MFRKNADQSLTATIARLYAELSTTDPTSTEYAALTARLSELYALKESNSKRRISPDTLAVIAGNVAVALIVVGYEQKHVIATKALNFVMKTR